MNITVHAVTLIEALSISTVEITVGKDRRRVNCHVNGDTINIYGIAVRYRTGTKVWHGTAIYWRNSGRVNNVRSHIDHRARFASVSVVGFWADFEGTNKASRA
jgi:hypothetical protein